jgi:hypothetical protein
MRRTAHALIAAIVLAGCSGQAAGVSTGPCTRYTDDAGGGIYAVGDAGDVEIYLERDRLVLVTIRPAEGWDHEVVKEVDGEIAVELSRPSEDLAFRATVEDGAIVAEWCR